MSTSTVNSASNALSQSISNKISGKSSLGKEDFLNLLVTQLQYQDPLSPMDDKEFVAQLAQFSSLEQLTNLNTNMETLVAGQDTMAVMNAVNFIGKEIKAKGNTLNKTNDSVSKLFYTLPQAASSVTINIMDSYGNIVRSVKLSNQSAGDQSYQWDGKDDKGNLLPNGNYKVGFSALNASGTAMMATTSVSGIVTGLTNESGTYMLKLRDGRSVAFAGIQGVVEPAASAS